jgi:hypothetical protein
VILAPGGAGDDGSGERRCLSAPSPIEAARPEAGDA